MLNRVKSSGEMAAMSANSNLTQMGKSETIGTASAPDSDG
jgi:hypothetical protein